MSDLTIAAPMWIDRKNGSFDLNPALGRSAFNNTPREVPLFLHLCGDPECGHNCITVIPARQIGAYEVVRLDLQFMKLPPPQFVRGLRVKFHENLGRVLAGQPQRLFLFPATAEPSDEAPLPENEAGAGALSQIGRVAEYWKLVEVS